LATFLELIIVFFAIFPARLVVAINRNPAPGGGGDKLPLQSRRRYRRCGRAHDWKITAHLTAGAKRI
jgi:hypothetical protein